MADITITKSRGKKYIGGASPIVPSYVVGEAPPPNNPPGTNTGVQGIGITLNDKVIGGVKSRIELADTLSIPQYWEYNVRKLTVEGVINSDGQINIG